MALTYSNAVNAWLKGETESPDRFSRETVTVLSGESVVHGEVVAKVTASGKIVPVDFSGSDGSQNAIGLMFADVDASSADVEGVIITRDVLIQSEHITWPDSETDANILIGLAALAARGIINRSEV